MPTRAQYRRWAAQELGPYYEYASGASDGAGTATLTVGRLASTMAVSDLLTDMGVIIGTATGTDQDERYVTTVSAAGVVTVDRVLSATSVWNSKTIEFHGIIKLLAEWDRLTTDALKRIGEMVEFTVTPTANATRHSLASAASWLTDPQWVYQVGFLTSSEARGEVDPYEGRRVRGSTEKLLNVVYLVHPTRTFASNETVYVKAFRPYYTLCRASGGTYGDQSGLSADTDEAIPNVEWVGAAMLIQWARRAKGTLGGGGSKALAERQAEWANLFNEETRKHGLILPERTFVRAPRASAWPQWRGY